MNNLVCVSEAGNTFSWKPHRSSGAVRVLLKDPREAPVGPEECLFRSIARSRFPQSHRCLRLSGKIQHVKWVRAPGSDLCANDAVLTSSHQHKVTCHPSSLQCLLSSILHLRMWFYMSRMQSLVLQSTGFSTSKHLLTQVLMWNFFIHPDYSLDIWQCFFVFFKKILFTSQHLNLIFLFWEISHISLTRYKRVVTLTALMEKLERINLSPTTTDVKCQNISCKQIPWKRPKDLLGASEISE